MKKFISLALTLSMVFCLAACGNTATNIPDETSDDVIKATYTATEEHGHDHVHEETVIAENTTTEDTTDPTENYHVDISVKDYGVISLELDSLNAPKTVENFVKLANEGFYDGLTFHRIMAGFMIQGGCPNGNGMGGSDENIVGEFAANGIENNISHTRGVISMARAQDYNSASSQFFIVHENSTFLDGQYAAFGYVTNGMDVVDAIAAAAQPTDDNGTITPDAQPVIESIKIHTH